MTAPRQRILVLALIGLGLLIVGFFGLRTLHAFREFRGHRPPGPPFAPEGNQQAQTDVELIRDWMTIPYISRMYHVPPPMLFDALGISRRGNEEKSLKQLEEEYYPDKSGYVLETIKTSILASLPPTAIPADTAIPPATAIAPATAIPPVSP